MKIVYVFPQLAHLAGTERILIDKMSYLADHYGYEVYALTYEQGQAPIAFQMSEKVTHVDLGTPLWKTYRYNIIQRRRVQKSMERQLYQRFMTLISQIQPDILIATPYHEIILDMIVRCPRQIVRILESHLNKRFSVDNDPILRKNFFRKMMAWRKMRRLEMYISHFDCLVALNQTDADDWSKCVMTEIIANMAHLNDGALSNLNAKSIIFAGRYTKQKGIPYLFKVWEIVHAKYPDWHLHLYGEVGEEYGFAIKEAERLGSNIHVNRSTNDIFAKYRESSILVLTSIYEPFGLVMPEAMSCGLPVVAFDCPYGPANIITDGEDGFLVNTCDVQSFANRVCLLIEDENLRRQMGKKAIASSQRYSAEIIMPKWNALFESFVNNPSVLTH
jgi:glycosyltransferase involved in cell wall biosynthesis